MKRAASSPPSPVLDRPPIRFIAMASVSCASAEIDPYDIAPVENRRTMAETGSTSSTGIGGRAPGASTPLIRISPRSVMSFAAWSSTRDVYSLKISYRRLRVACCSLNTVCGLNRCGSPSRRHWYSPPVSSRRCAGCTPPGGKARASRRLVSAASTSKPTPPSREVVPSKHVPMTSSPRPTASKICAPV